MVRQRGFDPAIRRFESFHPSQFEQGSCRRLSEFNSLSIAVFTGKANPALAQEITKHLHVPLGRADVGRFSDGEVFVELMENVRGRDVFIVQSTCPPAENLMELLMMTDACRRASARHVTAVVPYSAMRDRIGGRARRAWRSRPSWSPT